MDISRREAAILAAQDGRRWNEIAPDERIVILAKLIQKVAIQMGSKKVPEYLSENTAALDENLSQNLGFLTENEIALAFRWAPIGEVCEVPKGLTPANLYAAVKAYAYCEDRVTVRRRMGMLVGRPADTEDIPRKNFETVKGAAQQRWLSFLKTGHVEGTEPPQRVRSGAVEEIIGHTVFAKVSSLVYQWLLREQILDPLDWEDVAPNVADPIRRDALRLEAAFIAIRRYNGDFLGEVQKREFLIN